MKNCFNLLTLLFITLCSYGQVKNNYEISFRNAAHHEATVTAVFSNLQPGSVNLLMAKKSPDSYGEFNFAQNIYNLKITSSKGRDLKVNEISLNEWEVVKHDGEIRVSYTLFGDKADGIFSLISEEQTIINNPSAFIYVPTLSSRPVEIKYNLRPEFNWKIATQLRNLGNDTYEADNLQDFMDSPSYIAHFTSKTRLIEAGNKKFKLNLAIKHTGGEKLTDKLFNKITKVIDEQYKVFGSYPNYKNDEYTFIASFMPSSENNLIAHKNSSLILNTESLKEIEVNTAVKMLSETFFKSWNKTRITPITLRPFDFQKNTLTKEYWFTEGFSNYYGLLSMVRAGVISQDNFFEEVSFIINNVYNSPGLNYNSALRMSEKSLFYASKTNGNTALNAENLYIPYNDHGFVIALILDLELRNKDELNLDDFMSLLWSKYGKTDIGYSYENLYTTLKEYTSDSFTENFFKDNINGEGKTKFAYKQLLDSVGVEVTNIELPYLGADIRFNYDDLAEITKYTVPETPAYISGLEKGDIIISINNRSFSNLDQLKNAIAQQKIDKKVLVKYSRHGVEKNTEIKLTANPNVILTGMFKYSSKVADRKRGWIGEEL